LGRTAHTTSTITVSLSVRGVDRIEEPEKYRRGLQRALADLIHTAIKSLLRADTNHWPGRPGDVQARLTASKNSPLHRQLTPERVLAAVDQCWHSPVSITDDEDPHASLTISWAPVDRVQSLTKPGAAWQDIQVTEGSQEQAGPDFGKAVTNRRPRPAAGSARQARLKVLRGDINQATRPHRKRLLEEIQSLDDAHGSPHTEQEEWVEQLNDMLRMLDVHVSCPVCGEPSVLLVRKTYSRTGIRGSIVAQHTAVDDRTKHAAKSWTEVSGLGDREPRPHPGAPSINHR